MQERPEKEKPSERARERECGKNATQTRDDMPIEITNTNTTRTPTVLHLLLLLPLQIFKPSVCLSSARSHTFRGHKIHHFYSSSTPPPPLLHRESSYHFYLLRNFSSLRTSQQQKGPWFDWWIDKMAHCLSTPHWSRPTRPDRPTTVRHSGSTSSPLYKVDANQSLDTRYSCPVMLCV